MQPTVNKSSINQTRLTLVSRLLIALAAPGLLAVLLVPVWSIDLMAPQYPEGLSMQIWLNKITGQVDIINGLNHYIGMKHIKADMFPEFGYLKYILFAFAGLTLLVAVLGRRSLLIAYLIVSFLGGIAAMVDFYLWGYDYGHNLDPAAAIQVAGLSYQPPLIGHKKLLNFDAYSYPDIGAWIIIGIIALFIVIALAEWRRTGLAARRIASPSLIAASLTLLFSVTGCNPVSEKIAWEKDTCAECKMTLADPAFGAEIVTKKGRTYKFDDPHCLAMFLKHRGVDLADIHQTLLVSYNEPHGFINVTHAQFVVSSRLNSPMKGNAAAFSTVAEAKKLEDSLPGSRITNWATLYNILIK